MEKNQEFTVSIEDMSEDGAGIGKLDGYISVSYTHLDVYKRQRHTW